MLLFQANVNKEQDISFGEISAVMGKMWREVPNEEKKVLLLL